MGIPVWRGVEWGRPCPLAMGGISQLFGLATGLVASGILGQGETALIVRRQIGQTCPAHAG